MGGGSIKGICPVHLLDGCGLVLGRGGAEKIVGRGVWKERMCQRLVLEWAGGIMVVLDGRLIRKSNAVNDLLYSPRNVELVREQKFQVDDLFKMVTEVHKEYNALLPVEQQDKDEDWLEEIDASMLQFKQKIHGWIRNVERERDAAMEAKSKRSNVSRSVSSKRSSRHSSASSSGSRSSKSDNALKEKLRVAELLTEV